MQELDDKYEILFPSIYSIGDDIKKYIEYNNNKFEIKNDIHVNGIANELLNTINAFIKENRVSRIEK